MTEDVQKTAQGWKFGNGVTGVAIDSRNVHPGYVFVAIPGARSDGHAFIEDAINRGAIAVVGERPDLSLSVPYFCVSSSRVEAAAISADFFGHPSRHLTAIGVTGTNGKTSVVYWLTAILRHAGFPTGMVSSVINEDGEYQEQAVLTTPESPALQKTLRKMVDSHLTHAVIEISSHGIAQHRVDQLSLDLAILTNITREHLDFHGTMQNYVATKSSLFERLPHDSLGAVINGDDYFSAQVREKTSATVTTYGLEHGDVKARIDATTPWSSDITVVHREFSFPTRVNQPGLYNVYNVMAAISAAYRLGAPLSLIEEAIPNLPAVPGRMQLYHAKEHATVVIDYAHTPDGLKQALTAVRKMIAGDIWLVFGARGGRDRGKRPEMGAIAACLADHLILTSDSPNNEDAEEIAEAIADGVRSVAPGKIAKWEMRRDEAIRWAIDMAKPDDGVLITGRGPETYQQFHDQRIRLVDAEVVESYLHIKNSSGSPGVNGVGVH